MRLRYKVSQGTSTSYTISVGHAGGPSTQTLFSSDSGRSKPPSKTAGSSRNQNIYTPKRKRSSLLSDHRRAITAGRALRTLHVDAKVTRVFQISGKMKNCRYLVEPTTFGRHTIFRKEHAANGTLFDVRWSLVAQAIPESSIY